MDARGSYLARSQKGGRMSKATIAKDSREVTLALLAEPDPDDDIQREFEIYHANNEHVYKFLVHFARAAIQAMRDRGQDNPQYSIAAVVERARWHINFEVRGYQDFKINNDFRARYSRLIMRNETDLRGVFNLRKIRSTVLPPTSEIASKAIANLGTEGMTINGNQHQAR
jgi:hypothetical protein